MKYFFWIIGLLLLYVLISYFRFEYILHFAKLPKITNEKLIHGSGPALKYVALGDSTAQGVGASASEQTYPFHIANYLMDRHQVEFINLGTMGYRTEDVIKQLPQVIDLKPDLITISVGGNDVTHLKKKESVVNNFKLIIETLVHQTNARIYLTGAPSFEGTDLIPTIVQTYFDRQSTLLNKELFKIEQERVRWVNIQEYGWDKYKDRSATFSKDQFHPNDLGYQNWADGFLEQIKKDYK